MSDMSYTTKEKSQFMNVQGGEKKVMKKILSVALSTAMAFSMFASVAFGETAKVSPQQAFDALAAKGILNGYPDGKAHLEKDLTRGEFAKIVTKLFGLTEVTGKLSYKDKGYTASNWTVPYVEAVTAAGLMQGQDTVKGLFNYNGKVTVEEVAAVLFRALKMEQPTTTDNNASVWAKGYAQAVINAGLIAKDVNFKSNADRALVVQTAYAADQIGKVATLTVASAEAVSPTKVVVTFSDKTTANVELTTALVAGVETTINFKHLEKDYTAKVTLQAPKVVSVTAPNSKQVVVKFNRQISQDSVVSDGKLIDDVVKVVKVSTTANVVDNAEVVFNTDGTEATLTVPGEVNYLKGQYTVVVSKEVRTIGNEEIPTFTDLINVADVVAPTVTSVTAVAKSTTNKVYVKMSEPTKLSGLIAYVNGAAASVARDTYDSFVLTTGTLTSGQTYDVSLTNVSDFAGNVATPNPVKTSVTVTSDVNAPVIKSVTPVGDRYVEVVFDKKVSRDSLVGNVRLLDANGESKGVFSIENTSDNATVTLRSPLGSMSTTTFTGSILFGSGVKDTLGNTLGTSVSQAITFTKDTVAPTVTSVTYSNRGLVVKFSEKVLSPASGKTLTLISDSTGAVTTTIASGSGVLSSDKKSVTYQVSKEFTGAHTLRIPEGLVTDDSFAKNSLAATVQALTGNSVSTDEVAPEVTAITRNDSTLENSTVTVYVYAKDAGGLNVSTLKDVNSYTLDSKALPTGAFVTIETRKGPNTAPTEAVAVVEFPGSGISETKEYKFVASGIADTAGNGVVAFTQPISLTDRVKPTFKSAAVAANDGKSLILEFSEKIKNVVADPENAGTLNANNFEFKINNVLVSDSEVSMGTRNTSGTDVNKFYVTFNVKAGKYQGADVLYFGESINTNGSNIVAYVKDAAGGKLDLSANYINEITVKVKDTSKIVDITGNPVVTGTELSGK
ncbi:S-layer homology domain-containing protein [Paenibacillus rhizoplanae]|uniref:S-layer homology domain-containing protein n=1 Tax=Paenibacillus rhizoplanae TaxID=1917181 RepID=A0ABW5FJB5_9BACL